MTTAAPATLVKRLSKRLGGGRSLRFGPLQIAPEMGFLNLTACIEPGSPTPAAPGEVWQWRPSGAILEADLMAKLAGRTGGEGAPDWHDGTAGAFVHGVNIARVPDAAYVPDYGAVILTDGRVLHSSVAEARFATPTLAALPYSRRGIDGRVFRPPVDAPRVERAAVFMAWGGRFNYGHFLLDCLSSLAALEETGLLGDRTPVSPKLNDWQTELLGLMFGPDLGGVRQTSAPALLLGDAVVPSTMDHFLHAPSRPLDTVRARLLSSVDASASGPSRVYLSRRSDPKRRMVNEAELESALEARGFVPVEPGGLSAAAQIALVRNADVIVAPTGAALANTLFCKPGAKVFELQPSNFVGVWVRDLCHLVGADWFGYFAISPVEEDRERQDVIGENFRWRTPLSTFLPFLDERL